MKPSNTTNHEDPTGSSPAASFPRIRELLVLAALAAALSCAAATARPIWDDGWLEILQRSGGGISENMRDRPVLGAIWAFLDQRHLLWTSSYLIHWASWFSMGLVTMFLWLRLFPALPRFALAVGCLAVAPVICETQLVLVTSMLGYLPGIVMVYGAFLLIFSPKLTSRTPGQKKTVAAISVALVLAACLVSEYPVPTAMSCGVLGWFCFGRLGASVRERCVLVGTLVASAVLGYALYWLLADASARPGVRPENSVFGNNPRTYVLAVAGGLDSIWRQVLGAFLEKAGHMRLSWSAPAGAAGAICLSVASWRCRNSLGMKPGNENCAWHDAGPLVLALGVGMAPVVFMHPAILRDIDTRLFLPVLPLASCGCVFVLLKLTRLDMNWIVIPIVGAVVGYSSWEQTRVELGNCRRLHEAGRELRQHLAERGITVAVLLADTGIPATWNGDDYQLTARLTRDWSNAEINRFWAFQGLKEMRASCSLPSPSTAGTVEIRRRIRGVERVGAVSRLLLVSEGLPPTCIYDVVPRPARGPLATSAEAQAPEGQAAQRR